MSARRIIVERPIADEFTTRLAEKAKGLKAGDPKEHDTIIGPLINEAALAMVKGRVDEAVAEGREGARGRRGRRAVLPGDGAHGRPGGLASFARLETFGPVVAIEVVDSAEEAVARANATSVRPQRRASSPPTPTAASRSRSGSSRASSTSTTSRSATSRRCRSAASRTRGWGRFGGQAVIDEFTELRWITVQSGAGTRSRSDDGRDRHAQRGGRASSSRDGDVVALEGFTHLIPHAAGHELIRQGRRELTLDPDDARTSSTTS